MRMGDCFLGVYLSLFQSLSHSVVAIVGTCQNLSTKTPLMGNIDIKIQNHMILELVKVVECEHQTRIKLHCRYLVIRHCHIQYRLHTL